MISIIFKKLNETENAKAHQKLAMLNAGTIQTTSRTISVFTTKVNKPKVSIFIGNVRNKATGLTKALTTPKTRATTRAAPNPEIVTPVKI